MKGLDIVTGRKMNQPYRHADPSLEGEASQAMTDTIRNCQFLSLDGRGKSLH